MIWTNEQIKWLAALQSSEKARSVLSSIDNKTQCCLGVYSECCNIKRTDNNEFYNFEHGESNNVFLDWEKFNLYGSKGQFMGFSIYLKEDENIISDLATLNDETDFTHKEIAKFIFVYKSAIFTNAPKAPLMSIVRLNSDSLRERIGCLLNPVLENYENLLEKGKALLS
jgi:hypothetical protein